MRAPEDEGMDPIGRGPACKMQPASRYPSGHLCTPAPTPTPAPSPWRSIGGCALDRLQAASILRHATGRSTERGRDKSSPRLGTLGADNLRFRLFLVGCC